MREEVSTVVQSVKMSVEAGISSLDDVHFNLWNSLYGFVSSGLQKAIIGVAEALQEVNDNQEATTKFQVTLKELGNLRNEVEQMRAMSWTALSQQPVFADIGSDLSFCESYSNFSFGPSEMEDSLKFTDVTIVQPQL